MASKRKSKSRRRFLIGSGAAALVPTARASTALISVTPNFPIPKFGIGQEVVPNGDKQELHGSRAIIIGMAYNPEGSFVDGWSYLLLWTDIPESPKFQGRTDGDFWHESHLKPMPK